MFCHRDISIGSILTKQNDKLHKDTKEEDPRSIAFPRIQNKAGQHNKTSLGTL